MTRKPLMAANWKMNKTSKEAVSFIKKFKNLVKNAKTEIVVCPSFIALSETKKATKNTKIKLAAQNMHFEQEGAFTGETSPWMLKDTTDYVILGHSERRQLFNETNHLINKKIKTALKNKLKSILCVGESLEERQNKQTLNVIEKQIKECLKDRQKEERKNIVIAYEPVWAIGTGKTATATQAEEVHKFIRHLLSKIYNKSISKSTRIIYGGSVKPDNIKTLMKMNNIDGALVGGASLDPKSFSEICNI